MRVQRGVGPNGKEAAMAEIKKAMAIDANGDCYVIDEKLIKEHGKKLVDKSFKPVVTGVAPIRQADWPVCSWSNEYKAYFDCHMF
jgi:hypothetical protein